MRLDALEVTQQVADGAQEEVDGPLVLQTQHVEGDLRRHRRVAVAIAADPGAEPQRAGGRREVDPEALQLLVEIVEQVGDDVVEQLLEQVQRRRRLLHWLRPATAQLVGLPEQLHDLGEPTLPAVPLRPGRAGPGLQQLPDLPHLGEHRPAGGLGGVGREHRPHLRAADHRLQQRPGELFGGDPVDEGRQSVAVLGMAVEATGLVDLLDNVRQVEVGRERPHEEDLGGKVDARQHLG